MGLQATVDHELHREGEEKEHEHLPTHRDARSTVDNYFAAVHPGYTALSDLERCDEQTQTQDG